MIPIPACAVATSPVDGRVERLAEPGTPVDRGDVVAVVSATELRAPAGGRVGGRLADAAQPIAAGDGVVWLARG